MVLCVIIGAVILANIGLVVVYALWNNRQLRRSRRSAARQVDKLFAQARTRMEEAAGYRRPGERRIEDGFGTWQSW